MLCFIQHQRKGLTFSSFARKVWIESGCSCFASEAPMLLSIVAEEREEQAIDVPSPSHVTRPQKLCSPDALARSSDSAWNHVIFAFRSFRLEFVNWVALFCELRQREYSAQMFSTSSSKCKIKNSGKNALATCSFTPLLELFERMNYEWSKRLFSLPKTM